MKQITSSMKVTEQGEIVGKRGRPKKYTDAKVKNLADEMLNYFGINPYGKTNIEWFRNNENLLLSEFCVQEGLYPQKISELAQGNDYFAEAYKRCKLGVKAKLERIFSNFPNNRNITGYIFLAKNITDMRDIPLENNRDLTEDDMNLIYNQAKKLADNNA